MAGCPSIWSALALCKIRLFESSLVEYEDGSFAIPKAPTKDHPKKLWAKNLFVFP